MTDDIDGGNISSARRQTERAVDVHGHVLSEIEVYVNALFASVVDTEAAGRGRGQARGSAGIAVTSAVSGPEGPGAAVQREDGR